MKKGLLSSVLIALVLVVVGCTLAATLTITINPDPFVFHGPDDLVTGTINLQIGLGQINVTTVIVSIYEFTNATVGTEIYHQEFAVNQQLPIAFGSYEFKLEDPELLGPNFKVQNIIDYSTTDALDNYDEDLKGKTYKFKATVNGAYTATKEVEIRFE